MPDDHEVPLALLVDDDAMIRLIAAEVVAGEGLVPMEAADAAQAISILESDRSRMALLVTDVQIPGGMSGFDLAREVDDRWSHIAMVVASGGRFPWPGEMPATAVFLAKPFSAMQLRQAVRAVLSGGGGRERAVARDQSRSTT